MIACVMISWDFFALHVDDKATAAGIMFSNFEGHKDPVWESSPIVLVWFFLLLTFPNCIGFFYPAYPCRI